ncbi:MAG: hypothetical protein R3348_10130 [Xanthomonadales bacterium]|nr:hypothetical protein [Xanthomonadales bacterium]
METTGTTHENRYPETLNGNADMSAKTENTQVAKAPLYASPWLAFFYLIRQGLGQTRP